MSYTSAAAAWIESDLTTDTTADRPVSARLGLTLANNVNHLRDTCTQARVSHMAYVGETLISTDYAGGTQATPLLQYTVPWSVLAPGPRGFARPVLRVGAHRATAGTSYLSAGLFLMGARQSASGNGAIAFWPETSFTNTSAAIVIQAAADVYWYHGSNPSGVMTFGGTDPLSDGSSSKSAPRSVMVTLAIWVRHTGSSETRISLVNLREFSGPR